MKLYVIFLISLLRRSVSQRLRQHAANDKAENEYFPNSLNNLECAVGKIISMPLPDLDDSQEPEFENDEEYICEYSLFGEEYQENLPFFSKITGLDQSFIDDNKEDLDNGDARLILSEAVVTEETIHVPIGAVTSLSKNAEGPTDWQSTDFKSKKDGENSVVIVTISTPDSIVTVTNYELRQHILGLDYEPSLSSQIAACSQNKVEFVPAKGTGIRHGVVNIRINSNVRDNYSLTLVGEATQTALKSGLDLRQYDFVMFCVPPGTTRHFIAYSWLNGYRAVFNNEWCISLTATMHEYGHNLGLHHSGIGESKYADTSCNMGYSNSGTHQMCYNAIKTYELGWYSDRNIDINPRKDSWTGKLIGLVDYGKAVGRDYFVTLKIKKSDTYGRDIYLGFNRKKDFNIGTRRFQDEVTVIEGEKGDFSKVVASLGSGERYIVENFDSYYPLVIEVLSIVENGIDYANVNVWIDYSALVIQPKNASVKRGQSVEFEASSEVTWSVSSGGGTIESKGKNKAIYTAPKVRRKRGKQFEILATNVNDKKLTATATVTVN